RRMAVWAVLRQRRSPGGSAGGSSGRRLVSAGGGWERFELLERGGKLGRPWPVVLQSQPSAAAVEREPGCDMHQSISQLFRFGFGELAVKAEGLGPDDQVVREHHDLKPHLVQREVFERELLKAGVFVVADPVLDAGALAVTAFEDGDV